MIRRSFLFLSGVGPKTETALWRQGVANWDAFHEASPSRLPGRIERRYDQHARQLELADEHLVSGHMAPFARWLPNNETWRLLEATAEATLYLDIETTGLSYPAGRTTVVGGHLPSEGTTLLVRGQDLNAERVQGLFDRASCLVTFNGRRFDVPFLEREFGIDAGGIPHVDLMYAFRRVDVRGGLKSIEKQLGLSREDEIDGMEGYEAVRLWRRWERGDRDALDTLLRYNRADVLNMVPLADRCYGMLKDHVLGDVRPDGPAQEQLRPDAG